MRAVLAVCLSFLDWLKQAHEAWMWKDPNLLAGGALVSTIPSPRYMHPKISSHQYCMTTGGPSGRCHDPPVA